MATFDSINIPPKFKVINSTPDIQRPTMSTPTPFSTILSSFISSLPANPWYPYTTVAIFDESAKDGILKKAYHRHDFRDGEVSYAAAVRIFTRKVRAGASWRFEVGVGLNARVLDSEVVTSFYNVVGGIDGIDPSWKEVVETLRGLDFVGIQNGKGVGDKEKQVQNQVQSQEKQLVQMGKEDRGETVVQVPKPIPKMKVKERVIAIPKTRQQKTQTPRTPSTPTKTPTTQLTPSTTPTLAPFTSCPAPPSAETIAFYNSIRGGVNVETPTNTRPNAHLFTLRLTPEPSPTPVPAPTLKRKASTPLPAERRQAPAPPSAETIAFYNAMRVRPTPPQAPGVMSYFESLKREAEERRKSRRQ